MNRFDERYEIRLARASDVDDIMRFIDESWKKGHIMSRDKELFLYEYADGENINFILAIERETKAIEAIFGFLRCSLENDASKKDIWGSMWKVRGDGYNMPLLGIETAKRVYELTGCRMHIGNGADKDTTVPLRRLFFGDKTGKMKHYYMLNKNFKEFKIAIISGDACVSEVECERESLSPVSREDEHIVNTGKDVIKISSINELKAVFDVESSEAVPHKDNAYIDKRYFAHPYYDYDMYGIGNSGDGKVDAVFVVRSVEALGGKACRIVDYMGNHNVFANIGNWLENFLTENEYEYIDFYEFGFDENALKGAGFIERVDCDKNIIPNYFEPFVGENADIYVHYKYDGTTFFKGDGDQDRPNIYRCRG